MKTKKKVKKATKKATKRTIKTDDLPNISFGEAIRAIVKAKKQ